jgi:hypothetical protein
MVEYTIQLVNDAGEVTKETTFCQTMKEAKATIKVMKERFGGSVKVIYNN